ncbi:hypothetical protein TWF173_007438 [Orbilia oligospora]|nr:hypothetical protein TWF173_007438 [Orbilia oligospora]
MVTRAAIFTILMLIAYPTHSFKIAFHDPPIPGGPLDYTEYSPRTAYECHKIPQDKRTGEQKVDDIVVQVESKAIMLLAFYAVSKNPQDGPCSKQNLQIVASFPSNTKKDVEQYFTPIWPRLQYWRRLQPGSDDWQQMGKPKMDAADVVNRSGSGWITEKKEIQTRLVQNINIDPELFRLVQQNTQVAPQEGMNLPTMASIGTPSQLEELFQQQNYRPPSRVPDPKVLKDQVFELAAQYKTRALKANPNLKIDLSEYEPKLPDLMGLQQYKEDIYLEGLGPRSFTDYLRETANNQRTIGEKGGYMPVPLGIRHRFNGKKLNRLGFNVVPMKELKHELARQKDPHRYLKRFAGMGRSDLIGQYVPPTSEWEGSGGMMSLNTEVQSPRRVQMVEADGVEARVQDFTDLNGDLQKFLTKEELLASIEN